MNRKSFLTSNFPTICAPITGKTTDEIMKQLRSIVPEQPDLIEWRADFFDHLSSVEDVLAVIRKMQAETNIPFLFTIRSEIEGGQKITLTEVNKVELICSVCKYSAVAFVDYEACHDVTFINKVKHHAKENEKQLILSYHNFRETPANDLLIKRLKKAEELGADVAKLAVMPKNQEDVFRLLEVTHQADATLQIPIVTMSMGNVGKISRLFGWIYGSAITFGSGVHQSAPGQIPLKELRHFIEQTKMLTGEMNK